MLNLAFAHLYAVSPFSLLCALRRTLASQDEVQVAWLDAYYQYGVAREAVAPFDTVVDADIEHTASEDIQIIGLKSRRWGHRTVANFEVSKQIPLGTSFSTSAAIEQVHNPLLIPERTNVGSVTFRVDQPLLRNLCCSEDTAIREAELLEYRAVKQQTLQNIADRLLRTALAYWSLASAQRLLNIQADYEKRLITLVDNTQRLINENQLARVDINQPQAQLALQRSRRLAAEQALYAAWQELQLSMGCVSGEFASRGPELMAFPEATSSLLPQEEFIDFLTVEATLSRPDIIAAEWRIQSTKVLLSGANNAALPQLDLFSSFTARDHRAGPSSASLLGPLDFDQPQKDFTIGVSLSIPLCNHEAKGKVQQQQALYQQAVLNKRILERNAVADIVRVWNDQKILVYRIEQASRSVDILQHIVSNEGQKLNAGETTLFQVIEFENQLTAAEIERTTLLTRFAQSIAQLRYFTGTLLSFDEDNECLAVFDASYFPHLDSEAY